MRITRLTTALQTLPEHRNGVAPHRYVEALLLAARTWQRLGHPHQAEAALQQALKALEEVRIPPRQIEARVHAARVALALDFHAQARALTREAQAQALDMDDPWAQSELWPLLATMWQRLGTSEPLHALWAALEGWEDPWAQFLAWTPLLDASLALGDARGVALGRDIAARWDGPFVAKALQAREGPLGHPDGKRVLEALVQRARGLPDPFYRSLALSGGARWWHHHGHPEKAETLADQALADAQTLPDLTRRGEAVAQAGYTLACLGQGDRARPPLRQAIAWAGDIGYMDDRTRVLEPVLQGLTLLRDIPALWEAWEPIREIGYPRFLGPLARQLARAFRELGEAEGTREVLNHLLSRAREEGHVWKQMILLSHAVPALQDPAMLAQATEIARRLQDERYRAQALVMVAEAWARLARPEPFPDLWNESLALRISGPRQVAVAGVFQAWMRVAPEEAWTHFDQALTVLTYPHVRARVLWDVSQLSIFGSPANRGPIT